MKIDRIGVIYKIINKVNGKAYIGQTINKDPFYRATRHFTKMNTIDLVYRSFIKNNRKRDLYEIQILCSCVNKSDLDFMEIYFIRYYNTIIPNGYNVKTGGASGGSCSDEMKKKLSLLKLGKSVGKGIPKTIDHRKAMSISRKGFTSENRKISQLKSRELTRIKIIAIDSNGLEFKFNSIRECAKLLNLQEYNISRVINNKQGRKQHKGWKFIKEKA